jgi:hypothetical protein
MILSEMRLLENDEINQQRAVMPAIAVRRTACFARLWAGIQYAAAPAIQLSTLWNTGSPLSRG